jgi:hypothetical protein
MTHPSRCLRLFAVSVLLAWTGCLSMPVMPTASPTAQEPAPTTPRLSFLQYYASGMIGCPPPEVVIDQDTWGRGSVGVATFVAECRGHRFFCSYRMLEDVYCHEELVPIAPSPTKGPEGS